MNRLLQAVALATLISAIGPARAQSDSDPVHFSTPGWYRVIEWLDDDGETIIDKYIDGGPFADRDACEASIHYPDKTTHLYCDYFDSDPEE